MTTQEETALVKRAMTGDEAAYTEIYRHYQPKVYAVCLRLLANMSDAEDVTQNVFMRLLSRIKQFQFQSNFYTWLYRMAFNETMMHLRRHHAVKRDVRITESLLEEQYLSYNARYMERAILLREIHQLAASNLTKKLYQTYTDLIIHNTTHEEHARRLDITVSSSKSRLLRSSKKLKKVIEQTSPVTCAQRRA